MVGKNERFEFIYTSYLHQLVTNYCCPKQKHHKAGFINWQTVTTVYAIKRGKRITY